MIKRNLEGVVRRAAHDYPVVTITGPRQSGKTTLCKGIFRHHAYVSLEPLDVRSYAEEDPRGFLKEFGQGAVIDEVQNAPSLLPYIQEEVDDQPSPGRFILTGSQNLMLHDQVSQSLAGRTAVLSLLPLALDEIRKFDDPPTQLWTTVWTGGYPRIHDRKIPPHRWLSDYVTTYVQRDVRSIVNIGNLEAFTLFVRLAAARTGTTVNLSALGSDVGVSHNTARAWLSVLETGILCFRAPAWRSSLRKQLVKASKLHFIDSGLVCNLLGISTAEQLRHHPLRGPIFETWVASEIYKQRSHRGLVPKIFHFRDAKGLEVDIVVDGSSGLAAIEVKSGATLRSAFYNPLKRFAASVQPPPAKLAVIFGGERQESREGMVAAPWDRIQDTDWN